MGIDLLIHEVGAVPEDAMSRPVFQRILAHHTSPEDVGRVFAETKPKLAIYSHIARLPGANAPLTLQEFVNRTRTTYEGHWSSAKI